MPRGATRLDALLGYVAGISTYSRRAELATCRVLRGPVAQPAGFPAALARMGAERWRFSAGFTLLHAEMRADRGDVAGAAGQAAKAAIERAHELLCASGNWVLNEKRILERAGLAGVHALFGASPQNLAALRGWVEQLRAALLAGPAR